MVDFAKALQRWREEREMPNKEDELGGLWEKSMNDGRVYMTGTIAGQAVVIFANDRATNPTAPQWRVYKSRPKGE
jgi:uncharacterized protein (DUF736 family)